MRWSTSVCAGLGAAALLLGTFSPAVAGVDHDRVVSTNPADTVPVIEDGAGAFGVATVGSTTVVGGSFTRVRPRGGAAVTRQNIFAFNASGAVSTSFAPSVASRVWDVVPAGDGTSVYVGGQFNDVNGAARTSRVARVNVTTGQVMSTFRSPGFDNIVTDLQVANGRLYVGGYFKTVGGQPRVGLVALDATTGALTDHLDQVSFTDVFNDSPSASIPSGNRGVGVEKFSMTPDGSRLVAVGNFRTVSGRPRGQVAVIDTGGAQASVSDWATDRFSTGCHPNFPTYTLGVDVSPNGRYFAVATGGAFYGGAFSGTLCDSISRWELDGSGPGVQPTWIDYMGGDTSNAVHVTSSAVYIGGHFRWANDPFAGDAAGPGSVDRKGMAALDPRNGLPLSFNAGKLPLRWGVNRFVSTGQGLWVAHDGDTLGGEATGRLGLMPLAGGKVPPSDTTGALPGNAFLAGTRGAPTTPSPILARVNAGGPAVPATDGYDDWAADQEAGSAVRTTGSNAASWGQAFDRTLQVPASTPTEVFSDERWDPDGDPRMQWDFPAQAGLPLQVRLYFANGYDGTSQVGQRVFDVAVDGTTVLDDYDIVADSGGHSRGTVRTFDVTSDGNVDIDFSYVRENPLVSAIEIVRTDVTPVDTTSDDVYRTALTQTGAAGSTAQVASGGVDWSSARGAFSVDGRLYTGWADGTFTWRPFTGTSFGTPRTIDLHELTAFAAELPDVRGMWFDRTTGRMYFTLRGRDQLYYRYFTPESTTVGAVRFEAGDGGSAIDWGRVTGGFLAGGRLHFSSTDGALRSVGWQDGPVPGTPAVTSGPGVDGRSWGSGVLFLATP